MIGEASVEARAANSMAAACPACRILGLHAVLLAGAIVDVADGLLRCDRRGASQQCYEYSG